MSGAAAAVGAPAAGFRVDQAGDLAGDSASDAALGKLNEAIAQLKAVSVVPILRDAIAALRGGDAVRASELAVKALQLDERHAQGWHILAIAREQCGDFRSSLSAYEAALALLPEHADIAYDLGRLAYRMGKTALAAELFLRYREANPDCLEGANNLACALRDLHRHQEAIDVLSPAIQANPGAALLWNTLASILIARGDTAAALPFLEEAIHLDPAFAKARYTRAQARMELGDIQAALDDVEEAMTGAETPSDLTMMRISRSQLLLRLGRLEEGWAAYEARFDRHFAKALAFGIDRPRWTPEADLAGKSMLLVGEQGLGDEVMFANYLPDLLDALGPDGRLTLALERRLVPLFQRSFPAARVVPHATFTVDGYDLRLIPDLDARSIDLWAPLGSPLLRFRPHAASFPDHAGYLKPDPTRITHWRQALTALPGKKVGILWKSLNLEAARSREFSPFDGWAPILTAPGATFVNLQYGDAEAELAHAKSRFGVDIWRPPGIDLKDDLDDVAALCAALDLVLGPANATSNIAAACDTAVWQIATPHGWPQLGTDRYPWYPKTRLFAAEAFGQWGRVLDEVAGALTAWAAS